MSRIQLDKRFHLLDEQDFKDIDILGQILDWFRQPLNRSDEELLALAKENLRLVRSENVYRYIYWRLEFRTLIAAARLKYRNQKFSQNVRWGFGRWLTHINKHWNEQYFSLDKIHPWLVNVERLLQEENAVELEHFILAHVWQWLEKESFGHEFDLEAVALYRMRWDLVARWTSYTKEPAQVRFEALLNAAFEAA